MLSFAVEAKLPNILENITFEKVNLILSHRQVGVAARVLLSPEPGVIEVDIYISTSDRVHVP